MGSMVHKLEQGGGFSEREGKAYSGKNPISVGDNMKEGFSVRILCSISIIALISFSLMLIDSVDAHPPASMSLSYDFGLQELTVTITHSVSNPSGHYVDTVIVYRNSAVDNTYTYTSQPTTGTFSYTYSITASDGDSLSARADCNIGGSIQRSITVNIPDETDPVVSITSPANGSVVGISSVSLTGTASDNKELEKIQVKTGAGDWEDATGTSSWSASVTLFEGDNVVRARALDAAGNEAVDRIVVTYDPTAGDSSPPSIEIRSPNNGSVTDEPSVNVSGTASDDTAVDFVEIRLNGGSWGLAQGTISWTYGVILSEGANIVDARVTDTSGKTANDSIGITYDPLAGADLIPPSIVISRPEDGAALTSGVITVSGSASDDVGVEYVEIRVGNGEWTRAQGTVSWSLPVTLSEGSNSIMARAFDPSGNMETDSVSVSYVPGNDDQPPEIEILSPADGTVFFNDTITVSGKAADDQCPCRVEVRVGRGNWMIATGRDSWSVLLSLSMGVNTIEARITDDSGNTATDLINVTLEDGQPEDLIPPDLQIDTAVPDTVVDPTFTLRGTASDDVDVKVVEVRLNGGPWRMTSGISVWTITLELSEGQNILDVRAIDLSGNIDNTTVSIVYDPPYETGGLDGIIQDGEYSSNATFGSGSFEIFWNIKGDLLELGIRADAEGWVSLGISPTVRMKDADMIIGWVDDSGRVFVFDAFSTGEIGPHPEDTELGGTDDIIDFGGTQIGGVTTIEITRMVNSTDLYDRNFRSVEELDIVWGYSDSDAFDDYHVSRGGGVIVPISEATEDEKGEDDSDDEEPPILLIAVILIIMVAVLAAIAFYTQSKRKKEAARMEEDLTTEQGSARKPR
jgi:hypothetical protein